MALSGWTGRRKAAVVGTGVALALLVGVGSFVYSHRRTRGAPATAVAVVAERPVAAGAGAEGEAGPSTRDEQVVLTGAQQKAVGLRVEPVSLGTSTDVLTAPGQVVPDETRFVYITPRATGLVRSVSAREGQQVKAGDLLAMIDSPEVAQARFDLYTQLQDQEVARSQANWEETVYANTIALLDRVRAGDSPDAIDKAFENRPVGSSREQLIRAYTSLRLAKATFERNQELYNQKIISVKQFEMARTEYESALATYQSLTEQMSYMAGLSLRRAQQALRKAETATRVARARLRMFAVNPDGTLPAIKDGKVVGVGPDGTLAALGADHEHDAPALQPDGTPAGPSQAKEDDGGKPAPVAPIGSHHDLAAPDGSSLAAASLSGDKPVSTYPVWAPFDGTIIDRMLIVPGVSVDLASRLFTLADLSTVWIEVHIHESNYGAIARGREGKVEFVSPAYPGETFEAEVLYTGDMVDAKTRSLRLMARAQNPQRKLKPGMFVDVTLRIPQDRPAVLVPSSALLSEGTEQYVFVQVGPERFERRQVVPGHVHDGQTEVVKGLAAGDAVVTQGVFKLKAQMLRADGSEAPRADGPALVAGTIARGGASR